MDVSPGRRWISRNSRTWRFDSAARRSANAWKTLCPWNTAFESRRVVAETANSESLVRFDTNDYSVTVAYAHRQLTIVATVDEVRLIYEDRLVAKHPRYWERERTFFEPVHYLALLERKPGGFDFARPLADRQFPECFYLLRRRLESDDAKQGTRSEARRKRLMRTSVSWPSRSHPPTDLSATFS